MTARAIQTSYQGYRFRSRLEARWAILFDSLGIKWEYETEGYDMDGDRYLPDFWLPEAKLFVEIKPEEESDWSKAAKFSLEGLDGTDRRVVGLSGSPWPREHRVHFFTEWDDMEPYLEDCLRSCIADQKAGLFSVLIRAVSPFYYVRDLMDSYTRKIDFDGDLVQRCMSQQLYHTSRTFLSYCCVHECLGFGESTCHKRSEAKFNCAFAHNHPKLVSAYKAARSARFEHGETPGAY